MELSLGDCPLSLSDVRGIVAGLVNDKSRTCRPLVTERAMGMDVPPNSASRA
jgi:hypothetical protein